MGDKLFPQEKWPFTDLPLMVRNPSAFGTPLTCVSKQNSFMHADDTHVVDLSAYLLPTCDESTSVQKFKFLKSG